MFSILLRQVVSLCISKTEELVIRPQTIFHRTVYVSNVVNARINQKGRIQELDLSEGLKFSKDPDGLGKVIELDLEDLQREDIDDSKKRERKKKRKETTLSDKRVKDDLKSEKNEESDDKVEEELIKPKFEDLRRKSTDSFNSLMTEVKSKRGRERTKQIYLEGKRLIHDAIKAGHKPLKIYFSRPSDLEKLNVPEGVEINRVPYKKLQFWSDVMTSQGVIGIFSMPNLSSGINKDTNSLPLTIVCDNVREPSNLGSILRVVASVGCEKIILTQGCVDIWEPKVLRSAAGAHFHLPMLKNLTWTEIENEIAEDYKVVLASCHSETDENDNEDDSENPVNSRSSVFTTNNESSENLPLKCYSSLDYKNQNIVIVIGGETHGLSPEAVNFAIKREGMRVFIPMRNQVESLNNAVALGILSYMIRYKFELGNSSHAEHESNNNDDNNNNNGNVE